MPAVFPLHPRPASVSAALDAFRIALINRRSRDNHIIDSAADWLYDLLRLNIKRGRFYEVPAVLAARRADCLGFARLYALLAAEIGLDAGAVEVLVDNRGKYVPHHAVMLNYRDENRRFLDIWYGSKDTHPRRIGAIVDGHVEDMNLVDADGKDIRALPESCLDAITFYIKGNQSLASQKPAEALDYYNKAIELYPGNSRAFYNRALALEQLGRKEKAAKDFARALKDDAALTRVQATITDLEPLIKLDEAGFTPYEQDVFLYHAGFKTGVPLTVEAIAGLSRSSPERVRAVLKKIENAL